MEATSVKAKKNRQPINRGNIILAVISALLAVLIWVFLSVTVFTDVTVDLYDVGIDFDLEGSYANLAGLSVISSDVDSVNLSFTGRRDSYQDYTNEDVHIKLNLDNVKASGAYDIPLIAESTKGDRISDVVMVPESVHIVFDRIDTKILSFDDGTLTVDMSSVHAAEGHAIDPEGLVVTPSQLVISGPRDYINQVTSCKLTLSGDLNLSESVNLTPSSVSLYNGSAVFEHPDVTLSTDSFNVYVPVYITKELPLRITISGYNDQIDVGSIDYTLSTESILVRSEDSRIEQINEINLGYIDLRDIYPGFVTTFQIPPSSYYTNISGIDSVQVSFDLEGYSTKRISLSNSQIYMINVPADYSVVVEQDIIRATVVGPADILENLDQSNFIAQINLMDYELGAASTRFLTAYIYAPNYPGVWAHDYTQVLVSSEPKPQNPPEQADDGQDNNQ